MSVVSVTGREMYLFSRQSINSNSGPRMQATIVDVKNLTVFFHQLFYRSVNEEVGDECHNSTGTMHHH